MKKGPLSEEPLFCAHRARMKVSSTFSKVAGSRDSVPGRPPQRAEPPLCSHKRRRGSKGEPSPGVPPFSSLCACAPIRWEVVVTLSCHSTPFLWCLPKETVSSRQRKAPFYPGGSTIRVSAPASVIFTHLRPTWGGGWWLSERLPSPGANGIGYGRFARSVDLAGVTVVYRFRLPPKARFFGAPPRFFAQEQRNGVELAGPALSIARGNGAHVEE